VSAAVAEPEVDPRGVPGGVQRKIERGRAQLKKRAPLRRVCYRFWRGDSYAFVNGRTGVVQTQSQLSVGQGGDKPSHRIRNRYPFVGMIVAAKVSAATQRVPSYEIVPSKVDPDAEQAATLAEKVALYGYDKWRIRRATTKAVTHALVGGEGFAYPYFDNTVGPYIEDPNTGEKIGQGEIAIKILSGNEVCWEPGCDFDESRWYYVEQARPIDVVKEMPGYLPGELIADASDADTPTDTPKENLVLVGEYLERPSALRPNGRRLMMANKRLILEEEDYPCIDHNGDVVDEPVLLRLSYTVEVDDRDRSLVEALLDLQRTIQDCWNKILEYKNRCLNPQMTAPRGSNMARRDDTPGAVWFYNPIGGQKPEWERPPQIPLNELATILDKAIEHMRALSADVDVQPDPRLTASTAQQAVEQAQLRWQSFLGDLAEFHSRLMRRCLYLVQRHYSEARDIKIQGMFGPDLEQAFRGADLLGQADVRVSPDSLATKSRKAVIDETLLFADRGWISPQAAMATIQGGVAENLWRGWALDVGRANNIIQTIKRGPAALFGLPDRPLFPGEAPPVDPNGQPLLIGQDGQPKVPGYMPRPFDKAEVQIEVFESWMKTTEWDRLEPAMQHSAILYYQALQELQRRKQIEAQVQQEQTAQALGMANAARPQTASPSPDQRKPGDANAGP
jgi:hypothetical protein